MNKELLKRANKHYIDIEKTIKEVVDSYSIVEVIKQLQNFLVANNVEDGTFDIDAVSDYGDYSGRCQIFCVIPKTESEITTEVDAREKELKEEKERKRKLYEQLKKEFE